jgi:hypothetical protein
MQSEVVIAKALAALAAFFATLLVRNAPRSPSLDDCIQAMRNELMAAWYAPILAIRKGFDIRFLSQDSVQDLTTLGEINREAERRMGNPEELIRYLKEKGTENDSIYQVLHHRNAMADEIIKYIMNQLAP